MQPLGGAPTRDGNEILARLRERLNGFILNGQQIIQNQIFGTEKVIAQLRNALNDVAISGISFFHFYFSFHNQKSHKGDNLLTIGIHFIKEPEQPEIRAQTIEASRAVLLAVVRLLIMADMVDVNVLLKQADKVRERVQDVEGLKNFSCYIFIYLLRSANA
jgi:hypothetical protein